MMKAIRQFVNYQRALPNVINHKILGAGLLLLVLLLLTGCGEDAFVCTTDDCTVATTSTTTTTTTTTTTSSGVQMGNGIGINFTLGAVDVGSTALLTSGQTQVNVSLVNADQTAYATSTLVTFSATCGTFDLTSTGTSGGIATVNYIASSGCTSAVITATATVDGEALSAASPTITITTPVSNILFGSGSGNPGFIAGVLELGITGTLSAGGTTTVEATVVDGDNNNALYSAAPVTVQFTSGCVGTGQAVFNDPNGAGPGIVNTVGGIAIAQYTASGCNPTDTITATANINGLDYTATVDINIAPASVSRIQFVSADPEVLALEGTGTGALQETSTVIFEVLDNSGMPIENQVVTFGLDTQLGGLSLVNVTDATAIDGTAETIVDSGTIHTPFRVTAQTTDAISGITYSTQSPALVVSTGLADQNSFSLSISDCSPESYTIDGVTSTVQIIASDHFNNPVPEGTAISFTTEGGSIQGSCNTDANGQCNATWTSSNPRPPGNGRATILATALGNESFTDLNSNGVYDDGDIPGTNLPEAFRDDDEIDSDGLLGNYDAASEEYLDFDQSLSYSGADNGWTGVNCQHSTGCANNGGVPITALHVRESGVIIMATSGNVATFDSVNGGAVPATITLAAANAAPTEIEITVRGTNGQYPATGTNIVVETTNGTLSGTTSFTVPVVCTPDIGVGYTFTVRMNGDATPSTGFMSVKMTSPSGVESPLVTKNVSD